MTELITNDDEMVIIMVMMLILIIMMKKLPKKYQYHEFPFIWMYFLSSELDSH